MKRLLLTFALAWLALPALAETKDWKGQPYPQEFTAGVLGGIGVLDSRVGLSLPVVISKKLMDRGFSPEINNQVFLEAQAGPLFISGGTAFQYSLHLRWDFIKDFDWTFYGIGGLGGIIAGSGVTSTAVFYPRFGVGAIWNLFEAVSLRAELSHEFIGAGIHIPF